MGSMKFSLENVMPGMDETNVAYEARLSHLTRREHDVMSYLLRGAANKVIAAELGISQRTVESHRARLFRKMQVRNIVGLMRVAYGAAVMPGCVAETAPEDYRASCAGPQ